MLSFVRCFAAFVSYLFFFSSPHVSLSFFPCNGEENESIPRYELSYGTIEERPFSSRFSLLRLPSGKKKKESSKGEQVFSESRLYHKVAASFTNGLRIATPLCPLFLLFFPFSSSFLFFLSPLSSFRFASTFFSSSLDEAFREILSLAPFFRFLFLFSFFFSLPFTQTRSLIRTREPEAKEKNWPRNASRSHAF